MRKSDKALLARLGIQDAAHQRLVAAELPCGIKTVEEAWNDATLVQVNAPRVLMVCYWKGLIHGLVLAERARGGTDDR